MNADPRKTCQPCQDNEHADDGSGEDCPCCGATWDEMEARADAP